MGEPCKADTADRSVLAIVVTWNSSDVIEECLTSLYASQSRVDVVVVDNASTDDTVSKITKRYPQTLLIQSGANRGYAAGNNLGIRLGLEKGTEFLFVVNPDARVRRDCVPKLLDALLAEPSAAAVSPMIYYASDETIWYAGCVVNWSAGLTLHVGQGEEDRGQYPARVRTDIMSGCAMLLRSTAIERAGLMEESYFLYYEELDLSYRLQQLGYSILMEPSAKCWHKVSSSTGGYASPFVQYYLARNRLKLWSKFGFLSSRFLLSSSVNCAGQVLATFRRAGLKAAAANASAVLRAYIDFARRADGPRPNWSPTSRGGRYPSHS